jgi:RNA-directed DNA polymerase
MKNNDRLMEQLASPENLLTAWRIVRGNIPRYRRVRTAGPDGISLAEFERDLPAQLGALRHTLIKGRYQPQPPSIFKIEKRNGGERQIALLTITDRVAQRAAMQVLEPLYEPQFLPCNFGFRPGKSLQAAVDTARGLRANGNCWVVDGDIEGCFDNIDHQLLLRKVVKKISDVRIIELIHKWLEIGILNNGIISDSSAWFTKPVASLSSYVKEGTRWALDSVVQPDFSEYRPYHFSPITDESGDYPDENLDPIPDGLMELKDDYYRPVYLGPHKNNRDQLLKHRAIRQMTAGSLLLGAGWTRQILNQVGPAALAALRTTAGRQWLLRGTIAGGSMLGVTAGLLIAGYYLYKTISPASAGILQGSPLSPLLTNIFLHSFDVGLTKQGFHLLRYADDWIIPCPDQNTAENAYNHAVLELARIHLNINPDKTHILSPNESFEWLGEKIP